MQLTYNDITLIPRIKSAIASRNDPTLGTTVKGFRIEFPMFAAPMDTVCGGEMALALGGFGGVGIIHRFSPIMEQVGEFRLALTEDLPVGIALGVTGDYKERAGKLLEAWGRRHYTSPLFVCFDTANGYTAYMEEALAWFLREFPDKRIVTIAGNVASREGALFLKDLGADLVRLGIGSGSACTTSLVTGVGSGIVSLLRECRGIPGLIADGGIRYPGDAAKAFALGADFVMCGSFLAGFEESCGKRVKDITNGKQTWYKEFRGMSSEKANQIIQRKRTAEGISTHVQFKGRVKPELEAFAGGLRSTLSYFNCMSLDEFRDYTSKVDITDQQSSGNYYDKTPYANIPSLPKLR